jgi:hypothetical protein
MDLPTLRAKCPSGRIGRVRSRRRLLLALLVYVTLDLSLPSMPGAFVFDPGDSVESVQLGRMRAAIDVASALPLARDAAVVVRSEVVRPLVVPTWDLARTPRRIPASLPRATIAPASPSEDPH